MGTFVADARFMADKLKLILVLATFAGCTDESTETHGEPALPRALGMISAVPAIDTAAWDRLELRFVPVGGDDASDGFRRSFELSSNALPLSYSIGGDLGVNRWSGWSLTAWLTNATASDAPAANEPSASITLTFGCTDGCEAQSPIDLTLD